MFNDHFNFSNNLHDNLQIRKAFQKKLLKEAESRTLPLGDSETRNFINPPSGMADGPGGQWRGFEITVNDNPSAGTPYENQSQPNMSIRGALGPGRAAEYNPNDPYWSSAGGIHMLDSLNYMIKNWNNTKALVARFGQQVADPDGRQRLAAAYTRGFARIPHIAWPPQMHEVVRLTHEMYNK